jgi:hypothetical protein
VFTCLFASLPPCIFVSLPPCSLHFQVCLQAYADDQIAVNQASKAHSLISEMFLAMQTEQAYDATSLVFPAVGIGHSFIEKDPFDWVLSCLGVHAPNGVCSAACASATLACIKATGGSYKICRSNPPPQCHAGATCIPTLSMLQHSERPVITSTSTSTTAWGTTQPLLIKANQATAPAGSKCEWEAPELAARSVAGCETALDFIVHSFHGFHWALLLTCLSLSAMLLLAGVVFQRNQLGGAEIRVHRADCGAPGETELLKPSGNGADWGTGHPVDEEPAPPSC